MHHLYLSPHWSSTHRAGVWFFPLVSAYAAVIMPLTLYSFGHPDGLPGLANRTGHAYEMLFGVGLGLLAGYLVGTVRRSTLTLLIGGWLAGRLGQLWWPFSWVALVGQALFVGVLLLQLVPKLSVARQWRNRMLVPLVLLLGSAPVAAILLSHWLGVWGQHRRLADGSLLLFALLMMFMGGRAIAPAAAGAHRERGRILANRVQPRVEGALIVTLGVAAVLYPGHWPTVTGGLSVLAGALVLYRLARWRLLSIRGRTDLLCLGVGYGWLGVGVLMFGVTQLLGRSSTAVLHLITIGALGTLSTGMMARVVLRRTLGIAPPGIGLALITASLAVSALSRCLADLSSPLDRALWLGGSVAAWSTAYAGLTVWLMAALWYGESRLKGSVRL